jgi:hypothetical protein
VFDHFLFPYRCSPRSRSAAAQPLHCADDFPMRLPEKRPDFRAPCAPNTTMVEASRLTPVRKSLFLSPFFDHLHQGPPPNAGCAAKPSSTSLRPR